MLRAFFVFAGFLALSVFGLESQTRTATSTSLKVYVGPGDVNIVKGPLHGRTQAPQGSQLRRKEKRQGEREVHSQTTWKSAGYAFSCAVFAFAAVRLFFSNQPRWALQAAVGDTSSGMDTVGSGKPGSDRPHAAPQRSMGFGSSPAERSQERRELFNGIAPVYDVLNDALSLGQHRVWKLQTVHWSSAPSGGRAMDVCCGSGDLALLLALKVGPGGSVVALDFAGEMLRRGRARTEAPLAGPLRRLSGPIEWVQGDALALPFGADEFDALTMGYGLRNVVSIPAALRELRRVLRPGGTAAILDFQRPTDPTVAAFQRFYLESLVVPAATLAGMEEEYRYIAPSLEAFPTGPEQEELARQAGFTTVAYHPLAAGLMGCLVAKK